MILLICQVTRYKLQKFLSTIEQFVIIFNQELSKQSISIFYYYYYYFIT